MTPTERAIDSYGSYRLAVEALREIAIRKGNIKPSPDRPDEQAWAKAGPVDNSRLDAVRSA